MLLISSDALTVAVSHSWCDCAAQGFDECHCNDYLLPAAIVAEDPGETTVPQFTPLESIAEWIQWSQGLAIVAGDDDDDEYRGSGRVTALAEDPTDDPHDDRNGGSGKGSVAFLERCYRLEPKPCPDDCGCVYCS